MVMGMAGAAAGRQANRFYLRKREAAKKKKLSEAYENQLSVLNRQYYHAYKKAIGLRNSTFTRSNDPFAQLGAKKNSHEIEVK